MDLTIEPPKDLVIEGNFATYVPSAEVSLEVAVNMISNAIVFCRDNGIAGLLIDARELRGFPHPTVVDRYWFIRKWADDSQHQVVLSLVQRPEMIDPDQIGVTIASNAGLTANVFDDVQDARSWLIANTPNRS